MSRHSDALRTVGVVTAHQNDAATPVETRAGEHALLLLSDADQRRRPTFSHSTEASQHHHSPVYRRLQTNRSSFCRVHKLAPRQGPIRDKAARLLCSLLPAHRRPGPGLFTQPLIVILRTHRKSHRVLLIRYPFSVLAFLRFVLGAFTHSRTWKVTGWHTYMYLHVRACLALPMDPVLGRSSPVAVSPALLLSARHTSLVSRAASYVCASLPASV